MARPKPKWNDSQLREAPALDGTSGDAILDAVLRVRGITGQPTIDDWLDDSTRPAPDATLLPNMERALHLTVLAIERGARIGIFGDYDADGVTSTAIVTLALATATGDADRIVVRLPERAEGYGLTVEAVDAFHTQAVTLLIAADCGSNDVEALCRARELGIDVIVLDHHRLTRVVGVDEVVVNPHLRPDGPGHELVTAGVAYYYVAGLTDQIAALAQDGDASAYLDLAAIGTIADVGSLTGLNRGLVREGITELRRTARPGLRELVKAAGCTLHSLDAETIAFKVGPRLNAPGRVASPRFALDLLMADRASAARFARKVEDLNQRRRLEMAKLVATATDQVLKGPGGGVPLAVAHGRGWPVGLIGAVAGKLADTLGVPSLVLSDGEDDLSVGSARSVDEFDLFEALLRHQDLLVRFGGHTRAAGLTVHTDNVLRLAGALADDIASRGITLPAPVTHRIDADLRMADLSLATVDSIGRLAPFGQGNPEPLFRLRGVRVLQQATMGADGSHLRMVLDGPGGGIKSVMFGAGKRIDELAGWPEIDVLATIEVDTWGGGERLGLKVVDFRPAGN